MSTDWFPVYYGSVAEVLVLQETLEANGIPTLAPDVEHMDTATLAGSAYSVRLLVPKDRLALARSLVPESKRHNIPDFGALPADDVHASRSVAFPRAAGGAPEELGGEA